MEKGKVTPQSLKAKKDQGHKITRTICYDFQMARLADQAGLDIILVGDSLGQVIMGLQSTVPVTMEQIIHHCQMVTKAVQRALVIGDLPFLSYQTGKRDAVYNAGRLLKYGGVDAVKLEGGLEFADTVKAIVDAGIPVAGHIGLTPQMVAQLGGYKVQGTDLDTARKLIADAEALEAAGAFMISSLECVPDRLAQIIAQKLSIPVVGIGSGPYTDGQALNMYDILGIFDRFHPKFVKSYANLSEEILKILTTYKQEVENGTFPSDDHSYHIKDDVLQALLSQDT